MSRSQTHRLVLNGSVPEQVESGLPYPLPEQKRIDKVDPRLYLVAGLFNIPRNNIRYLLIRGFTGFVGLACAFTALRLLTISQATVIFFTNPFFTSFLAFLILKERLVLCDILAMICGITGIFFMFRPSFVFGQAETDPLISRTLFHNGDYEYLGIGLGLLGAFCAGIAYTSSRKVLSKTHFTIPSVFFSVFSTILMPVLSSV